MKIEKMNDHQIRCILTKEDLATRQIKLSELAYGSEKAKSLFHDMMQLEKKVSANNEEESTLDIESLEVFENIAYIMAKHANRSVPDSVEDWLDQFQTLSIYQVLPQLIELWNINIQSDVQSKKNLAQLTAR